MDIARARQHLSRGREGRSCIAVTHPDSVTPAAARNLIVLTATLLFAHGQTTERMKESTERLARALGFRATLFPYWGELIIRIDGKAGQRYEVAFAEPAGIDMAKVAATVNLVDQVCAGLVTPRAAQSVLETIERLPPVSLVRLTMLAAAGAGALGVIFGAVHPITLILIAFSAGAGACLRRWLEGISHDPFVQPFVAALLAGAIGAIAVHYQLGTAQRLIAVCPCMVLVPGPHLLNGAIDLARGRIALGASRIGYASLIIAMICTGLLVGLSLGGITLPVSAPSHPVPFGYDVIAAGVAVAAYGTFFAMPWRMLPVPILIGMLAHAVHWLAISVAGYSMETGALLACLLVGIIVTSIADRLRLPFAAVAFASVVSLIPGVFLFRMGSGVLDVVVLGERASTNL
ncbi:MAG: threonine/serine exporter family protein, partial [Dongiaceae bacterium]